MPIEIRQGENWQDYENRRFTEFDPNKMGEHQYRWATYVPARYGNQFKLHKAIGHAKNAAQYRNRFILYRWNGEGWTEVYRKDTTKAPDKCERCFKPFETTERQSTRWNRETRKSEPYTYTVHTDRLLRWAPNESRMEYIHKGCRRVP